MALYAFVVAISGGDEQEYRVSGPSLDAEEAVQRCYANYPEGTIEAVLNGDTEGVDLSNPNIEEDSTEEESDEVGGDAEEENAEDDGDSTEGVTSPFDPADFTLAELEDEIRGHSDEKLAAVLDAEMEGKDRAGAKDRIYDEMEGYQP